jgi:endo-1,4-beta-xylanase
MRNNFIPLVLLASGSLFYGCSASKQNSAAGKPVSLKEVFKKDFGIGTALNNIQIEEKDPKAAVLIPQQFNMATPENIMKAEIIHPQWDT